MVGQENFPKCPLGVQVWTSAMAKLTSAGALCRPLYNPIFNWPAPGSFHSCFPLPSESLIAQRRCHRFSLLSLHSGTHACCTHGDASLKVLWTGQVFNYTELGIVLPSLEIALDVRRLVCRACIAERTPPLLTIWNGVSAAVLQLELSLTHRLGLQGRFCPQLVGGYNRRCWNEMAGLVSKDHWRMNLVIFGL